MLESFTVQAEEDYIQIGIQYLCVDTAAAGFSECSLYLPPASS